MKRIVQLTLPAIACLLLTGCNAISGASAPPVVAVPAPVVPAGPPPVTGVLAGPLGASLTSADRRIAFDAERHALDTNSRQSWRGAKGVFGYVSPSKDPLSTDNCRNYKETVFINGRAKSATGKGCRLPDGSWKLSG